MKCTFAVRVHRIGERSPSGVRSAILIVGWLALTFLFVFGGVVLVDTVVTALGQSQGLASFLLALVGVLGAIGVSPTLAQATVVAALERFETVFDRYCNPEQDGRLSSLCDSKGRTSCEYCC